MIDLLTIPVGLIGFVCWAVVIRNVVQNLKDTTNDQ